MPAPFANQIFFDTATDPDSNPAADLIGYYDLTLTIPYFQESTATVQYDTVGTLIPADLLITATFNADLYDKLLPLAWLVSNSPDWAYAFDSTLDQTTAITGGENFGLAGDTAWTAATIVITTVGPGVDYWWGSTNIAKFGLFAAGNPAHLSQQWLNLKNITTYLPRGATANSWYCNLAPGCAGTIVTHRRRQIPDIAYSSIGLGISGSIPVPQ